MKKGIIPELDIPTGSLLDQPEIEVEQMLKLFTLKSIFKHASHLKIEKAQLLRFFLENVIAEKPFREYFQFSDSQLRMSTKQIDFCVDEFMKEESYNKLLRTAVWLFLGINDNFNAKRLAYFMEMIIYKEQGEPEKSVNIYKKYPDFPFS